jgi:hypothetical protein
MELVHVSRDDVTQEPAQLNQERDWSEGEDGKVRDVTFGDARSHIFVELKT